MGISELVLTGKKFVAFITETIQQISLAFGIYGFIMLSDNHC